MKNLNNLTIIIVTYMTNKKILLDCLKSINKKVKIIIVENSSRLDGKKFFLKNFTNIDIKCTGANLGYGKGNNFGLNFVKTDYVLILNPDIICGKELFSNIKKILDKINDFSIVGCQYLYDKTFMPAGYFNYSKNKKFKKQFFTHKQKMLTKVDWVTGCSMLINLKKFDTKKIFDENYFLFFEEFDLCKTILKNSGIIYTARDLRVHHLGFKGSIGSNKFLKESALKLRDWHFMWSTFYFYKKNFNFFYALFKVFGKLLRSILKIFYFTFFYNQKKRDKYLFRFLGIVAALFGKKSSYRGIKFH